MSERRRTIHGTETVRRTYVSDLIPGDVVHVRQGSEFVVINRIEADAWEWRLHTDDGVFSFRSNDRLDHFAEEFAPMYLGVLRTINFTFTALGESEAEVREDLGRGWAAHQAEYGVERVDPWEGFADEVEVFEIEPGTVLRDGEPIYQRHDGAPFQAYDPHGGAKHRFYEEN